MASLAEFLVGLAGDSLGRIYAGPWACIAVFRCLPPMAKQYVLRLLYVEDGLPEDVVEGWASKEGAPRHWEALERLTDLDVMQKGTARLPAGGETMMYKLSPTFQKNLLYVLSGRLASTLRPPPPEVVRATPTHQELEAYAIARWEGILLHLSSSQPLLASQDADISTKDFPPLSLKELFRSAGLTDAAGAGGGAAAAGVGGGGGITGEGGRYLLKDTGAQLWLLVREWIATMELAGVPGADLVGFILRLGFRGGGEASEVDMGSPLERCMVSHLAKLGVVLLFQVGAGFWYCRTPMAALLCGDDAVAAGIHAGQAGNVIVETNYRVYVYTTSELQLSIVKMFVRPEYRVANLFVGSLTRESVTRALDAGISAEQIVGYLEGHAHPHVAKKVPIVPEAVADQVRLWEGDSKRVQQSEAVMYESFESEELFRAVAEYARGVGASLWEDPKGRRLVCQGQFYDDMRAFIKAQKQHR